MGESPELSSGGEDRRAFMKRLVVAGFAVPVVVTFSTAGIEAAFAQSPDRSGAGVQPTNEVPTTEPSATTTAVTPTTVTTVPGTATTTTTTVAPTTTTTTTTTTVPPTTTTTEAV